ncbi:MAG: WecB/TagA/CpsF family glycosyltransferase [Anaerolineae bacterium]|nr:WecB/TagA/CpsF family glycosyltransferase [Anaerolineae bacterium]
MESNKPERILLVQLADIGDLITTTPAIAALREAQPQAHLTLLTSTHAAPIIERELVDEIITFDRRRFNNSYALLFPSNLAQIWKLRKGKYDTVVIFHRFSLKLGTIKFWLIKKATQAKRIIGANNGNGWFLTESIPDGGYGVVHQAQHWLNLVGLLGADTQPRGARIAFDDGVLPLAAYNGIRIIIHAGSGGYSLARRWNPEYFAKVSDALHDEFNAQIVLVGTANDDADEVESAMQHKTVNLAGKTTLTQLADVIRSADLYIGSDSGVLHVAASVRTPVVTIFGSSNHEAWSPWSPGGKTTVIRSAPECSPCSYVGQGVGLRNGCEARTCMRMVTPEQVIEAARATLNDSHVPQIIGFPHDARNGRDWQDTIRILGLPVDRITYEQWMDLIDQWVQTGTRSHHVCTTNPEFTMIAQKDVNFANILRRADLCIPDGIGLLWASKFLRTPITERITGSDGTERIAQEAAKRGWKLFFLGAADGVADEAANILTDRYPNLQVVGRYAGSPHWEDEDEIVKMVNFSGADILLVAYGAPQQDKWIARNMPRLRVKMAMGVGGSFDFITGKIPRAPEKVRSLGLEWAYRLYKQPWRIFRMMRLPQFVFSVILRGSR